MWNMIILIYPTWPHILVKFGSCLSQVILNWFSWGCCFATLWVSTQLKVQDLCSARTGDGIMLGPMDFGSCFFFVVKTNSINKLKGVVGFQLLQGNGDNTLHRWLSSTGPWVNKHPAYQEECARDCKGIECGSQCIGVGTQGVSQLRRDNDRNMDATGPYRLFGVLMVFQKFFRYETVRTSTTMIKTAVSPGTCYFWILGTPESFENWTSCQVSVLFLLISDGSPRWSKFLTGRMFQGWSWRHQRTSATVDDADSRFVKPGMFAEDAYVLIRCWETIRHFGLNSGWVMDNGRCGN